jgi:ElaA protein
MIWAVKEFGQLTTTELFRILKARCEVFIVEQDCPYLDPDDLDLISIHIFAAAVNGDVAAYCRVVPKETRFPEISIGRVITTEKFRRTGLGQELMRRAIEFITVEMGESEIRISAQAYLRGFYESFGFRVVAEEGYLEDGIPHFEMLYTLMPHK